MLRSKWVRALVAGMALGMGAGMAMAKPIDGTICMDTCKNRMCQECARGCTNLDCYVVCMTRFPSC